MITEKDIDLDILAAAASLKLDHLDEQAVQAARTGDREQLRALAAADTPNLTKLRAPTVAVLAGDHRLRRLKQSGAVLVLLLVAVVLRGAFAETGTVAASLLEAAQVIAAITFAGIMIDAFFAPAIVRRRAWPAIVARAAVVLRAEVDNPQALAATVARAQTANDAETVELLAHLRTRPRIPAASKLTEAYAAALRADHELLADCRRLLEASATLDDPNDRLLEQTYHLRSLVADPRLTRANRQAGEWTSFYPPRLIILTALLAAAIAVFLINPSLAAIATFVASGAGGALITFSVGAMRDWVSPRIPEAADEHLQAAYERVTGSGSGMQGR